MKMLLTFIFPSWRLFDDSYETPILYLIKENGEKLEVFPPIPTKLNLLFINPEHNYYLYFHSAINRLINEMASNDFNQKELMKLKEFQIILKLMKSQINLEVTDQIKIMNRTSKEVILHLPGPFCA